MPRLTAAFVLLFAAAFLQACNSTNPTTALSALTSPKPGAAAGDSAAAAGANSARDESRAVALAEPQAGAETQAATPSSVNAITVALAPSIGAPADAIPPLSESMTARAARYGIKVAGNDDAKGVSHILKGYFSAIAEGSRTTVIYVWDVLDPSGTRLHRIQGQQSVDGGGGDGWSSVSPTVMQAIGTATVDSYAAWLSGRQTAGG